MSLPSPTPHGPAAPAAAQGLLGQNRGQAATLLALSLLGWSFLAWLAFDMAHPFAQLTMPASARWSPANTLAIFAMWAVMMAAMMLPSALPMILTFSSLSEKSGERGRSRSFVAAYLSVWLAFSAAASLLQWALQQREWITPMVVSRSPLLSALLLVLGGIYQFSPLKRTCLAHCRTPLGFLIGEWRAGTRGAYVMGLRHGLLCLGCCWALMALLFVGGAMNLAWIAALAVAVAIEKLAPAGDRVAPVLGAGLIAAGLAMLLVRLQ